MRILISTYYFFPSIGGIETAGLTLARGLVERGHQVTVVTLTPAAAGVADAFPFTVVRNPSFLAQMRLARQHDLVWQNGVCLRLAGLFFARRPIVFAHHGPLQWAALKRLICAIGVNVFVSPMMQNLIRLPGPVIPNSYDEHTFQVIPGIERDRDLIYVGRLVPEKGVDLFIAALGQLARKGLRFRATVTGLGPEESKLKAQAADCGVSQMVDFTGAVQGRALAELLNRHKVLVVPPRWEEPFGIVALEGLACGCVAVGTQSGGLVDAIGPAGLIVPKNDANALAQAIEGLMTGPELLSRYRRNANRHLRCFTQSELISRSEDVIVKAVANSHGSRSFSLLRHTYQLLMSPRE
jgi:glycogen(starch) synthase